VAVTQLSYFDLKKNLGGGSWSPLERRWPRPLGLEGIEAILFRTIGAGPSGWELLLLPEVLRLPASWRGWMRCWMIRCSSRRTCVSEGVEESLRPLPSRPGRRAAYRRFRAGGRPPGGRGV